MWLQGIGHELCECLRAAVVCGQGEAGVEDEEGGGGKGRGSRSGCGGVGAEHVEGVDRKCERGSPDTADTDIFTTAEMRGRHDTSLHKNKSKNNNVCVAPPPLGKFASAAEAALVSLLEFTEDREREGGCHAGGKGKGGGSPVCPMEELIARVDLKLEGRPQT
jgi:hypothetical protein